MPTTRHYARNWRRQLRNEMQEQLEVKGNRVVNQLERLLKQIVNKTLRFSSQFGTVGLRDAHIEIDSDVRVHPRRGLLIKMVVIVLDGAGNPHQVWHIISFGRKPFVQRRTSPVIRPRRDYRTTADTLVVQRFPGYKEDDEFVIPAGTVVDGIEARNWYQQIAKEFEVEIQKYPSIKALNLRLVRWKIRKPDYF